MKKITLYLLQLLVIIVIVLCNHNEIIFCAGIEPETLNNLETAVVYAQETQPIMQPAPAPAANNDPNTYSSTADFVVGYCGVTAIVMGVYYIGKPFVVCSVIPTIILYIIFSS